MKLRISNRTQLFRIVLNIFIEQLNKLYKAIVTVRAFIPSLLNNYISSFLLFVGRFLNRLTDIFGASCKEANFVIFFRECK